MIQNWFEDYARKVIKGSSKNVIPDNVVNYGIISINKNGEKTMRNITTVKIKEEEYKKLRDGTL